MFLDVPAACLSPHVWYDRLQLLQASMLAAWVFDKPENKRT